VDLHAYPNGRPDERKLLALFALACGILIAIGIAVPLLTDARTPPSPVVLGNVSEAAIVEVRDHRGRVVLAGEFRTRVDAIGNIEKDAALLEPRGTRIIGEIEVEIPAAGREHRRPELEVDVMGLAPREIFTVVIDDRVVGTFTTDDRGSVDMELQEGETQPREAEI
jgi:hypothetical protein